MVAVEQPTVSSCTINSNSCSNRSNKNWHSGARHPFNGVARRLSQQRLPNSAQQTNYILFHDWFVQANPHIWVTTDNSIIIRSQYCCWYPKFILIRTIKTIVGIFVILVGRIPHDTNNILPHHSKYLEKLLTRGLNSLASCWWIVVVHPESYLRWKTSLSYTKTTSPVDCN